MSLNIIISMPINGKMNFFQWKQTLAVNITSVVTNINLFIYKRIFLDIFFMPCYWIDKLLSLVIQTSVLLKNDLLLLQWRWIFMYEKSEYARKYRLSIPNWLPLNRFYNSNVICLDDLLR